MSPSAAWRVLPAALRSLARFRRRVRGTAAGACLASVLLTGSLLTGASVRLSLEAAADRRLGAAGFALEIPEDFVTVSLAGRLERLTGQRVIPVLRLSGLAGRAAGTAPLRRVEVLGVDESFFSLFGGAREKPAAGFCAVGSHAASVLGVAAGEELILNLEKRGLLPLETPAGRTRNRVAPLRLRIGTVASGEEGGAFSLRANQTVPLLIFISLAEAGRASGLAEKANLLVVPRGPAIPATAAALTAALREAMTLEDYGLSLDRVPEGTPPVLRDQRVFIRPAAADAARALDPSARGRLVYFVNRLAGAPYSFVAAAHAADLPFDPGPDGIFISDWLAADRSLQTGDAVSLSYYVIDDRATLVERAARFTVRGVLPQSHPLFAARLTPDFPGLTDVPNCRDWRAGVPVDVSAIRPRDEEFWNRYRAAPKAVLSLDRGRALWGTRFGDTTSLAFHASGGAGAVAAGLLRRLDPARFGLVFTDHRARARAAVENGVDFSGLFTGLGCFAVAASLILSLFLFSSAVAERGPEIGLLRAVGFSRRRVFMRLGAEGALTAFAGSLAGALAGPAFTALLIALLATLFRGAVAGAEIGFYFSPSAFATGWGLSFVFSLTVFLLTVARHAGRPAVRLLSGADDTGRPRRRPRAFVSLAAGMVFVAGAAAVSVGFQSRGIEPVFFFISSVLLLAGLLLLIRSAIVGRPTRPAGLFAHGPARAWAALRVKESRALASIIVLALGVYLVTAVGANTSSLPVDPSQRDTGTGGFALFMETSVPVAENLNDPAARVRLGLDDLGKDVFFLPMRVSTGDDSSCLNLNRAQQPELVGLAPEALAARGAFAFTGATGASPSWRVLDAAPVAGVLPALADEDGLTWGLGLAVGDRLALTDETGREREVYFAGALRGSLFQGSILVSEKRFLELFPSSRGYTRFLVDAPEIEDRYRERLAAGIENALRAYGARAVSAVDKLRSYQEVTNTYLLMFLVLGGLGLIIGLGGFGVFIRRHAARRAGEFALLAALGFSRTFIRRQFLLEQLIILCAALVTGLLAAVVALLPAVIAGGGRVPWILLAALFAGMGGAGFVWTRRAVNLSLRGDLIGVLKRDVV